MTSVETHEEQTVETKKPPKPSLTRRKFRAAALSIGLFLTAGWAVGGLFGIDADYTDQGKLDTNTEFIANTQNQIDTAHYNIARQEQAIGEACTAALRVYVGGALDRTHEDTAVDDLLNNPGRPCGDTRTNIRIYYESDRRDFDTVNWGEDELTRLIHEQEGLASDAESSETTSGTFAGAAVGLAIGGIGAAIAVSEIDRNHQTSTS